MNAEAKNPILKQENSVSPINSLKPASNSYANTLKSILPEFIWVFAIIAFLFTFFWPAVVDGPSMEPTFISGDYLIISRISAWTANLKPGDFVACEINNGTKNITIIKRLAAVAGDTVTIRNGRVTVNGNPCDQHDEGFIYRITDSEFVLGKDEYFVIGDNGSESFDSRQIGVLNKKQMVAKVLLRLYPFGNFTVFR